MRKKGEEKKGTGKEDRSAKKGKDVWKKDGRSVVWWMWSYVMSARLVDGSRSVVWRMWSFVTSALVDGSRSVVWRCAPM